MRKRLIAAVLTIIFIFNLAPVKAIAAQGNNPVLKVGDYVRFGSYNAEAILWRVISLDKDGDPLLFTDKVISYKFFDAMEATKSNTSMFSPGNDLWRESTLRQWLNSDATEIKWKNYPPISSEVGAVKYYDRYDKEKGFLTEGNFSTKDRNAIKPVALKTVITDYDRDIRDGGTEEQIYNDDIAQAVQNYDKAYYMNTVDKVFLLSVKELHDYIYARGWDYKSKPTAAAVNATVKNDMDRNVDQFTGYMLRCASTNPKIGGLIRQVMASGSVSWARASSPYMGVRPALYLRSAAVSIQSGDATLENPYVVEGNGTAVPQAANKVEQLKEGYLYYSLLDGKVQITGYSPEGPKKIVIPEKIKGYPVTSIGEAAFISRKLTGVILPKSLTSIGKSAFYDNSLTSLTIVSSIKNIGESAFAKNTLSSVKIEASLITIGKSVFAHNALKTIVLPASLKTIEREAFYANKLASIRIPEKVTSIGEWAFRDNELTSITIPNGVADIKEYAFRGNKITNAVIGSGVKAIGFGAFDSNKLTSLKLGSSVKTIGEYAFANNQLTNLTIPDSVAEVKQDAFAQNRLTAVKLGKGMKIIGHNAFFMNRITSIVIPNGVTTIGKSAFASNLITKATLPNSIRKIDMLAFSDNRLTSIALPGTIDIIESGVFSRNQLTKVIIPNSVKVIKTAAFANNKLTSVTIGNRVESIEANAFLDNKLTGVTIPASVTYMDFDIFYKKQSKPVNFTIKGITGSEAQKYAKEYGYKFLPLK